ncbi:MAG: cohesin domain-containing protein [Bacteroidota bacterium]
MKKKITPLCMAAMLILSLSARSQDGLFISEVTDPADDYSGRFIELFNAGPEAVDFSSRTIYLSRQSNGGTGWGDLQLEGMVAAGETFVIGGSAFAGVFGFVPDQETGILIGNGDDAYFLYLDGDHVEGTLHDIYGALDTDGTGEPWEYEDSRAVRVQGISIPNPVWTDSEWEIASAGVADCDPGTHHGSVVDSRISLVMVNDTVGMGQPVEIPVSVSGLTAADQVISYQFDIHFDHSVLEYTGNELAGTLAEGGTVVVNSSVTGKLSVSYMNTAPMTGAGVILKLRFNALAPDTTELTLSNAYLNNNPVQDITNATVIVMSLIPPTATITYNDTLYRFADTLLLTAAFSQPMDQANAVQISFSGAATLETEVMTRQNETTYIYSYQIPKTEGDVTVRLTGGTNLWGNEVVPVPAGGETFYIVKFVPGDVDDDGRIMAYDAALALQHSVGLDPLPAIDPLPWEPWRDSTANVDGSGAITAYDAGMILQYSAGIITSFSESAGKSASYADVTVRAVEGELIFYSHGALVGLNIFTTNEHGMLGIPVVLGENLASLVPGGYLSAFNNKGSAYRIGFCTAVPPGEGAAILRVPYYQSGPITFLVLVNGDERALTLDLGTGMDNPGMKNMSVYPNPARDRLVIQTGEYGKMEGCLLSICNQLGVLLFETRVVEPQYEIDITAWSATGVLYVRLTGPEGAVAETRKVVLQ